MIAYVRRVLVSFSRLDGQRWRCGAGGPSPPLALLLRSIAADTGSMARVSRLVAAVEEEQY